MTQKPKYQTKSVKFGGKTVTMYSLDGLTWSTRRDELETIQERHEQQKVSFMQIKGDNGGHNKGDGKGDPKAAADGKGKPAPKPPEKQKRFRTAFVPPPPPKDNSTLTISVPALNKLLGLAKKSSGPKVKAASKVKFAPKQIAPTKPAATPSKAAAKTAPKPAEKNKAAAPKKRLSAKLAKKGKAKAKRAAA